MSGDADRSQHTPTTYERLAEHFATSAHKRVKKGGREQTYVPWTDKVDRFNAVLGSDWSFRMIREGLTETEAWVLGEITATIDGVTTVRQQYGCEPIAKGQRETPTSDLFKIAGTDALSKAATLFGCGLYLSIQEERAEVEAAMQEAIRAEHRRPQQPDPTGRSPGSDAPAGRAAASTPVASGAAPSSSSTTATPAPSEPTPIKTKLELVADLKRGIDYARTLGLDPKEPDCASLHRAQIEDAITALRRQCRSLIAERKKIEAS